MVYSTQKNCIFIPLVIGTPGTRWRIPTRCIPVYIGMISQLGWGINADNRTSVQIPNVFVGAVQVWIRLSSSSYGAYRNDLDINYKWTMLRFLTCVVPINVFLRHLIYQLQSVMTMYPLVSNCYAFHQSFLRTYANFGHFKEHLLIFYTIFYIG